MPEHELDHRGHRRAVLHGEAAFGDQFGVVFRRGCGREREVVGAADGLIESAAAAVLGGIGGVGQFARGGEPVIEARILGHCGSEDGFFRVLALRSEVAVETVRIDGLVAALVGRIERDIGRRIIGQAGRIDRLLDRRFDVVGERGEGVAGAGVLAFVLVIFLVVTVERIGREIGQRAAVFAV